MNRRIKRLISGVLSVIIAGSCTAAGYAANVKYGDMDNDGKINSADALIVLTASVGAKKLTADETKRADVDGNGKINSSDALDILLYSVGSLKKFKVENSVPSNGDEILAIYSNAVKKARKEIPSYRFIKAEETKDPKIDITSIIPLSKDAKDEFIKKMEDEIVNLNTDNKPRQGFFAQRDSNALAEFVPECRLTDSSKLKSITAVALDDGNYKIDIKFNDESKPKASGTICSTLGFADYATMEDEMVKQSNVEGVQLNVQFNEYVYKNCSISCEINPATGEFVRLEVKAEMYSSYSFPMGLATITASATDAATHTYWDFAY